MQLFHSITPLQQTLAEHRRHGRRIAVVPTMGGLHAGHIALVDAARQHADIVVATIFVNPLQFSANEDLTRYPRTLDADRQKLEEAGCDLLFAPDVATLYPDGLKGLTHVHVPTVSEGLCGARRPGHFDGVSTVVSLIFHLILPDVAFFGEKDFQQLAVIRKMVRDLHFNIEIVGVPTVRNDDGLALSSRNDYLSHAESEMASLLYRTLQDLKIRLEEGALPDEAIRECLETLTAHGFKPDYLELRRTSDLGEVTQRTHDAILLVAAYLGTTRLIDNIRVALPVHA
ncbi:pantoate--beta-alanine ligase [Phytohalomonas tamaricis]|uniref:pantoate--beta-alanine ligase n=1 Tax=Phytohalomonas tamaricis TaxID=2081032 RepID=UPI000D0AE7F5|nr:pantoate--beta-alanine ligase [Phytohalomonas tamaricis]